MIPSFAQDLNGLQEQFQAWIMPKLDEISRIGRDAQKLSESEIDLDQSSDRKGVDLATVNSLIAPLQAFVDQATALATAKYADKYQPNIVKALARQDTLLYVQAYNTVERLGASLTHQLQNHNSRIWKTREEIKAGLYGK